MHADPEPQRSHVEPNKRTTHVLVRAGRKRLKLDEAAIVVQRRALILVCPLESRASLDDNCVFFVYLPPVVERESGEGGQRTEIVELNKQTKLLALVTRKAALLADSIVEDAGHPVVRKTGGPSSTCQENNNLNKITDEKLKAILLDVNQHPFLPFPFFLRPRTNAKIGRKRNGADQEKKKV